MYPNEPEHPSNDTVVIRLGEMSTDMPPVALGRVLIDSAALCLKLGLVDDRMVTKLIREEGLPVHHLTPRLRRFDVAEVDRWIDSRCTTRHPGENAA